MDRRKIYFGHPINVYDSDLETFLLKKILEGFPEYDIENPNQNKHAEGYTNWKNKCGNGMEYYSQVVLPGCRAGVFLPFRDGAWGAGVFQEAKFLADQGCLVWIITLDGVIEIADLDKVKVLTVDETRLRIRDKSGQLSPF